MTASQANSDLGQVSAENHERLLNRVEEYRGLLEDQRATLTKKIKDLEQVRCID